MVREPWRRPISGRRTCGSGWHSVPRSAGRGVCIASPSRILDNVRELESYRFVVVEDQIVIVKPEDRSIALVIDRM